MIMLTFISNNQHRGIFQAPLHMFPSRAASHAATFIITPADIRYIISEVTNPLVASRMYRVHYHRSEAAQSIYTKVKKNKAMAIYHMVSSNSRDCSSKLKNKNYLRTIDII